MRLELNYRSKQAVLDASMALLAPAYSHRPGAQLRLVSAATVADADADADADAADTLEDDEEPGTMFAEHEMQKLVSIERARRNPARILFDHPHLGGLVISICDADFTYFDWGDPGG